MTTPLVPAPLLTEIRQHNALINSPFVLSTLEWRALTALLQRISPDDEELKEHFIPAAELVGVRKGGGKAYKQIRELSDQITERKLSIEQLGPKGERVKKPDYRIIPLLALASYVKNRGGLVLVLNPFFRPYLLQLAAKGNFTKGLVADLQHLKGSYTFKLYWLLAEYRTFGTRTFTVLDLRFRLGIREDEYVGRFDNFKTKVLDKAQVELSKTDLAFEMEILRKGQTAYQVRFTYNAQPQPLLLAGQEDSEQVTLPVVALELPVPPLELEPWVQSLQAVGVSAEGCDLIRRQLAQEQYPIAYLDYVLAGLRKPRKSPVRKPADYLFKCITGKLLLDEFQRSLLPPPAVTPVKSVRAKVAESVASTEKVLDLIEVRQMYEHPGPYAKRMELAPSFEEHLQRIYLSQGFVLENKGDRKVLILREG